MKKTLLPVIAFTLVLLGCESTAHYYRTKVVSLKNAPTEVGFEKQGKIKPYGSVKFFQSKEEVTSKYEIIALLSVEGRAGEEAAFIKAFLYRAADLGADGIIFYRGQGGSAAPVKPSQDASYRAEAIVFQ